MSRASAPARSSSLLTPGLWPPASGMLLPQRRRGAEGKTMKRREPPTLRALVPWWFNPVLNCGFRIEVTARPAVAPYRWEITGRDARGTLRRGGALFWNADFQSAAGAESMARPMRPPIGRRAWKPALPEAVLAAGHCSGARTFSPPRARRAWRGPCARPLACGLGSPRSRRQCSQLGISWSADFQSAAGAESMARPMRPPIGRRAWKPALPGKGALRAAHALGSSLCVLGVRPHFIAD